MQPARRPALRELFASDARMVGFDGSQVLGVDVETHLTPIFADHPRATYVAKIRGVQTLRPQVVLLSAIAGIVPPGQSQIDPALNAEQHTTELQQVVDSTAAAPAISR